MKRTLFTALILLGFSGTAFAQAPYYIPGMPVPQQAPAAAPAASADAPAQGNDNNAKINKVSVAGKHAETVTPETSTTPAPSKDFSKEEAALATQAQKTKIDATYKGVIPVINPVPENEATFTRKGGNQLSWIGFQPSDNGHSIFIQTLKPTTFERLASKSDRVEILLSNTKLAVPNNRRELDMSFFQTPFAKAQAVKSGKNVKVIIHLKEAVTCEVTQQDNMIHITARK